VSDDDLYARKREAYKRIKEILQAFDHPEHDHAIRTGCNLLPRIGRDLWSWLKHLQIFPLSDVGGFGVFLCDYDVQYGFASRALYFSTKAQAEDFVARVRAGMDQKELETFVKDYFCRTSASQSKNCAEEPKTTSRSHAPPS